MIAGIGHNGMTRDEWLRAILHSGQVTRIAQHLALVIYHLSDPKTNTAKLSARDLERITGWGRTAIADHIDELLVFMRVTWGTGRAKSLFELSGVISASLGELGLAMNGREAATTADTTTLPSAPGSVRLADTMHNSHTPFNICGSQTATTADTRTEFNNSVRQPDTMADTTRVNSVLASAKRSQNEFGGDYRGGDSRTPISLGVEDRDDDGVPRVRVREAVREPPSYVWHDDGSFGGTAFEHFTTTEIAAFRATYPMLEIRSELPNADRYLADQFEREGIEFGSMARLDRLHRLLNAKNRAAFERITAATQTAASKSLTGVDDSCWFDQDRLMVANGFKADLLAIVGNDEGALRRTLDKAAVAIPITLRGLDLRKAVRGHFTRNAGWDRIEERKAAAVERRAVATAAMPSRSGVAPPPPLPQGASLETRATHVIEHTDAGRQMAREIGRDAAMRKTIAMLAAKDSKGGSDAR